MVVTTGLLLSQTVKTIAQKLHCTCKLSISISLVTDHVTSHYCFRSVDNSGTVDEFQ